MFSSVRTKLTLWYVCAMAVVLISFCVLVYLFMSRTLHSRVDIELISAVDVAIVSLRHDIAEGQDPQDAAKSTVAELLSLQNSLAIFDHTGTILATSPFEDANYRLPELSSISNTETHLLNTKSRDDDDGDRIAVRRITIAGAKDDFIILVSQPMEMIEDELELIRETILFFIPIALVLSGIGGWFLARKSLSPVVAMADQARQIGAQNLERQLPVFNANDELGRLAITFNELLNRLNAAFAQQRQFMADASHELRTPLSIINTTADITLNSKFRTESEYREALATTKLQTRRLTRIVEDMFMIARADSGHHQLRLHKFYLDETISEAGHAAAILATLKNIRVEIDSRAESLYQGDEDLVRRMVMNLLENAVKYTHENGNIKLSLTRQGNNYLIEVADTGIGIPKEERDKIFDRFYRCDKARSRADIFSSSGAGLGLSIARWIAEAHCGSLSLRYSNEHGSAFLAVLPITNRQSESLLMDRVLIG